MGNIASRTEVRAGPLHATVATIGSITTVSLSGELDLSNVETLGRLLAEFEEGSGETLVVDLERLEFIDSSGIAMLINAHSRLDGSGASRLRIIPSSSLGVRRTFRQTGLDEHLPLVSEGPPA